MLTYDCTSLNPVAGVVVGAGHGRQLPVRWCDIAELVTEIRAAFVQGGAGSHCLIVNYIV